MKKVAILLLFASIAVAQTKPPAKPQAKPPEAPKRQRVATDVSGFDLAPQAKVKQAAGVAGASRGANSNTPLLLAPNMGKLYGPSPRFNWSFNRRVRKFVFVLADENRDEIYRADVTRPEFQYPSDAPRLEPGKTYYWHIEPDPKNMDMMSSDPAGLKVISGPELQEIEQALSKIGPAESYESGLARARLFADHRLWYDALSAYGELMEKNPNQAELYDERSAIYAQLEPTKDLADRDAARAREIKK
jgi:Domain of Unknown Function (DUF928)